MVDKIAKALAKLSAKKKDALKEMLVKIKNGELQKLDVKKLKGRNDIFRVRSGEYRVIFYKKEQRIKIISLEKRSDNTYK